MLTKKQRDVLFFIDGFIKKHGISPTYVQIANQFGYSAKSSGYRIAHALRERGYIRLIPHKWRAIEVLKLPPAKQKYIKMDFDLETQRYSQTEIDYDPNLQKA